MTIGILSFALMQGTAWLFNGMVRPHRHGPRSVIGIGVHALMLSMLFGGFLGLSGSAAVAGVATVALMAVFVVASNAKHAMLGEPLSFSDLALFAALVRHPRFYLSALSTLQQAAFGVGAVAVLVGLAWLFVPDAASHLAGVAIALAALGALVLLGRSGAGRSAAPVPDLDRDLALHGLIAVLLLYWLRWRETPDPPACTETPVTAEDRAALDLILVIQCESFADPVALTGNRQLAMPGLARARSLAVQSGNLSVSGFGAYTMRTEFGVLFGRSEAALGFRRYDPFLSARGEASYAIPARLGARGYQCLFVHPHDLRFYGRDRLMPAIGFDRLIGEKHFPTATPGNGRYVEDRAVAAALGEVINHARKPTFIYTVTMENHGPWRKDRITGSPGGLDAYLHHLRNSDAMLTALIDHLLASGSSALLVFFGDHRPSIPGIVEPGADRHTPYVMLRFADGKAIPGNGTARDLTPDELHHAILRAS
ncbi:LTA synthase family protein [Sphingomonas sp. PAMC 26621]|uniref:LTA synthase family protein n=1 Tax=Sphingomonas sp. PAMC 26621 TaxID=1112213 RepID=UPI000288CA08|nr:LTA synthase family protein [Sphingomonas sp. PAMC 26621]